MHIDFNLLNALDILLEEQSISNAAARLHVTQPAMSRTLGRIRAACGDEILVRSGRRMLPTPFAERVRSDVHRIVQEAGGVLRAAREVDPAHLDLVVTLRCHDAVIHALAPELVQRLQAAAPGVRIRFLAETSDDSEGLRSGSTDLEIGGGDEGGPDILTTTLGADRLVVVCRSDHPAPHPLSAAEYAAHGHVSLSRRGRMHDVIDDALAHVGLKRRIALSVPSAAAALGVVARTDLMTVVPVAFCADLIKAMNLRSAPLPVEIDPAPVTLRWHRRTHDDAQHRWVRNEIASTVSEVLRRADRTVDASGTP